MFLPWQALWHYGFSRRSLRLSRLSRLSAPVFVCCCCDGFLCQTHFFGDSPFVTCRHDDVPCHFSVCDHQVTTESPSFSSFLASLYIVLHGLRPAALMIHLEAWDMFPAPCFACLDCRFTVSMELLGRLSPHRVQDIKSRRHNSRLYRPNNPRCSLEDGQLYSAGYNMYVPR